MATSPSERSRAATASVVEGGGQPGAAPPPAEVAAVMAALEALLARSGPPAEAPAAPAWRWGGRRWQWAGGRSGTRDWGSSGR